ncbi:MAG: hypothetical protein DRP58_09440, partial [Spirochaetes bacterium]
MRSFTRFSYRNADYRIASEHLQSVTNTIITQRETLEKFIVNNQDFYESLIPVSPLSEDSPHIAKIM